MLEQKNIQNKKYQLGQFFTPETLVDEILPIINITSKIIIEPSFGDCGFITPMIKFFPDQEIIGIELDEEYYKKGLIKFPNLVLYNKNFYDMDTELDLYTKEIAFVGNVPFRSPAYSLSTHADYVKKLSHKYGVTGIKEEAVFFIIKTADLIISKKLNGSIHYIIPKSLITNDSKFYKQFKSFLKKYFKIVSVTDIDPKKFDNVAQDLIFLQMRYDVAALGNYMINHNGTQEPVDSVIQLEEVDIPFHKIFKKTYLGSVPAESFLFSVPGETKLEFCNRLSNIFNNETTIETLKNNLKFNGKYHLKVLSDKDIQKVDAKLVQIYEYIKCIKNSVDLSIFSDINNYKPINHRKEIRYYFRHISLRGKNFVYEINPNPGPSFYFTSNPSSGSTDYFGYCSYDISRNSSPGCCRTVPLDNIEDNLVAEFKTYWNTNTNNLPYRYVFGYIKYVASLPWYKTQKKLRKRFYFCLPRNFIKEWLLEFNRDSEDLQQSSVDRSYFTQPPVFKESTSRGKILDPVLFGSV